MISATTFLISAIAEIVFAIGDLLLVITYLPFLIAEIKNLISKRLVITSFAKEILKICINALAVRIIT